MKRRVLKVFAALAGVVVVVAVVAIAAGWTAFGKGASGERRARMQRSPQWRDGHFNNAQPMFNDPGALTAILSPSPAVSPHEAVPFAKTDVTALSTPPPSGLRVTWFGHAASLIEIDGVRVLTDPAFGERASPFDSVGPARWFPPPLAIDDVGAVDAVVISHDHHDHLQYSSVKLLKDKPVTWFVPLGVGAHLEYWGVDPARIAELDWWEKGSLTAQDGRVVEVDCVPARHASGRQVLDQGATLWASWAFVGAQHRVFFSGDTGLHSALAEIGQKLGPFDLTMIEVGQYHPTWPDWHIGPEQAVKAHQMLRGKTMLPIHWALWTLAPHGWTEPGERVVVAAQAAGVPLVLPRPGESFEPTTTNSPSTSTTTSTTTLAKWWPTEPWQTAQEQPIVSTVAGDPAVRMP